MKNIDNPNGIHYLMSFFGCDIKQIDSMSFWKEILPSAIAESKIKILHKYYYKFDPQGITCFLLLSSSHLSVHTWPEFGYIALDLFSCAEDKENTKIISYIIKKVKHSKTKIKKEKRGYIVCS